MYDIQSGQVDIYVDFGGKNEKKVAQLMNGELFGEMGILDDSPRSATAVAGADDTEVVSITKKEFGMYFIKEPVKILYLMQQMSDRLRDTTKDYLEACQTLYESEEANKANSEMSDDLKQRIRKFSDLHKDFGTNANS
jgi:CRP-like cAMP-binding protein